MKELKGFRPALHEAREYLQEFDSRLTKPEATAMAVRPALTEVWGQLSQKIGESKSTEEVFGVPYKEFLEETQRRQRLADSSGAMQAVKEKLHAK